MLTGSGGVGLCVATGGVPIDGGPLLLTDTPGYEPGPDPAQGLENTRLVRLLEEAPE